MLNSRALSARITIDLNDPVERQFQLRKLHGILRMRVAGVRPASVTRYARRGWPRPWVRAFRREIEAMTEDLKRRPLL